MKKLYIKALTPIESLTDLINNLYMNKVSRKTYYANPTYRDKKCTEIECTGQRRSFEDLLFLARTYFPETTEVGLLRVLIKLRIKFTVCSDIRKIVFSFGGAYSLTKDRLRRADDHMSYARNTYTVDKLLEIYEQL